jgi:prepilin-type N-terminal cleavage/methylation domain-containing protein
MKTPSLYSKAVRAFTLVELLVVIGIIALLISILLPVIGKVREQGTTVKCMSNLRQIHLALNAYAAEYKGSLPWGFIWENPSNGRGDGPAFGQATFMNWASSIARYMNVKRPSINIAGNYSLGPGKAYFNVYAEAMRCPAVEQQYGQILTYTPLMTAMPNYYVEFPISIQTGVQLPILKPAKFGDLYNDNTLMWDSAAWNKCGPENPTEYYAGSTIYGSYGNAAYTFIDGGQLTDGNVDYRFRDKYNDVFSFQPDLAQGYPIIIPSRLNYVNSNTDVNNTNIQYGQCGTPRFRHNREKACNALIADGSVRTFVIKDIKTGGGKYYNDANYVETDWLRKYIMIKFPS